MSEINHTIELRKVSKYYAGKEQVSLGFSRVDLSLDMGEFVAITGESGSGKSTLLNIISGLDNYDEGEMFVCGEDTSGFITEDYEQYRKQYIGNIFQDFNIINSYSVYENVELVMLLNGKKKKECKARVKELLELVGLSDYAKTKASRLSGGQKQRVAIARALAKDAPIIVADEPTGNLDSESAASVMKILAEVSKDKLVIIVTHNYDQVEQYVTRKLTMHDGKVIEDKKIVPENHVEQTSSELPSNMGFGGELRLGIRNSFNLPAKFILLFIVYLFIASAVIAQYASLKSSLNETGLLGYNDFFTNISNDRVVVTRKDHKSFTNDDIATLEKTDNVGSVVRNDLNIDRAVTLTIEDSYLECPIYPVSQLKAQDLTAGRLPEKEDEVVISCNKTNDVFNTFKEKQDTILEKSFDLADYATDTKLPGVKVKVVGIILVTDDEKINSMSNIWACPIYMSDAMSNKVLIQNTASSAKTWVTYYHTEMNYADEVIVFRSKKLKKGEAYIFSDHSTYYPKGEAKGKTVKLKIETSFFSEEINPTIVDTITSKNIYSLTGYKKDEYEYYMNRVYISYEDYAKLFDKGSFQVSVFMENTNKDAELVKALNSKGYNSLVLKNSLSDVSEGFDKVLRMFSYLELIAEFIILFFISYAVIRLIMKSRNSYYATLRMLGATKGNTVSILRIELVVMMLLAYAVDLAAIVLVRKGVLEIEQVYQYLEYIQIYEYAILGAALVIMSLLIAQRYSRKIFQSSAMQTFREGA